MRGDLSAFVKRMTDLGAQVEPIGRDGYSIAMPTPDNRPILEAARDTACQLRELVRQELSIEDAFVKTLKGDPARA